MNVGLSRVYLQAQRFSRVAALATIVLFATLHIFSVDLSISLQIAIALLALLLGIPHGAIDHLISLPARPRSQFSLFIVSYVLVAVMAAIAIATWNVHGFQAVLVMSALHFGIGDAAYANEWRTAKAEKPRSWILESAYAIPAGFLPVILPLTNGRSLSALNRINCSLGGWAGSHGQVIRQLVLVVALLSALVLMVQWAFALVIDLALLVALSWIAPPLITFAIYFGCWHAVRHTARLVPKLPAALAAASEGRTGLAFKAAIAPGLYAVAGTLAIGAGLMVFAPHKFGSSLLWSTLVIVWGLTVPHMLTTARFDWRAVRGS
jgi:Brp/Blh family beta-carotene 15,15'-monooxygenase